MSFGLARGVVASFDAEVGLGEILDGDEVTWPFHCTAIADGTRAIAVGAKVTFERTWGGPGRWEAGHIRT